jgi:hypothetical protein
MPLSQQQKNYSLYLAAAANKISDVKLCLSGGAEVVSMENNGDYSVPKVTPHSYSVRGVNHSLPMQSAIHYALACKNIEIIALLAPSASKKNAITWGLIHFANALDIENSCAKYLAALTNPDHALEQLKAEQEAYAVSSAQMALQRMAATAVLAKKNNRKAKKNAKLYREKHIFDYVKLEALTFRNDKNDAGVATLNTAIARTYVEAKKLYDASGYFTIGMQDKARNIVKQLQHLYNHYENIEPKPAVFQYYNDASSGNALTEIVQKKRTLNPFVMHAKSWNHLAKVTPDLKQSKESQSYRR